MKILQLCLRFPPAPGGVENHVYSISKELQKRKHEVKVFTSDLYTEIPFSKLKGEFTKIDNIPVKRFNARSLKGTMRYVVMPSMLSNVLKGGHDVIHAHSYGYFHTNISALAKKLGRGPFVFTPHFHPEWTITIGGEKRKKLRRVYDKYVAKAIVDAADIIIGVSRHEIELMREIVNFDQKKVRYIPNGIDFSRFDPIPSAKLFKEKYKEIQNQNIILYVGRLATNKGLEVLIDAAPMVLKTHPRTIFVLVGEDEGMKDKLVKKLRNLKISDKFLFTGHIKDEKLFRSAYAACDVFVLPSEYEAFGIVLLEAMVCKKPVLGTRVGGIPEAIGKEGAGVVVEYNDPKALAQEMIKLLDNPKIRQKMGELGRERVKNNFTWESIVDQIEKVYAELI